MNNNNIDQINNGVITYDKSTINAEVMAVGQNSQAVKNNSEPNFDLILFDFKQFINNLENKYSNLDDEDIAVKIIDAEAEIIKSKDRKRWQDFLNLKRLWNGGKKATIKVGEHFTENNIWGKGAIAFLEGVSEDVR
jgi:hypothetical protein